MSVQKDVQEKKQYGSVKKYNKDSGFKISKFSIRAHPDDLGVGDGLGVRLFGDLDHADGVGARVRHRRRAEPWPVSSEIIIIVSNLNIQVKSSMQECLLWPGNFSCKIFHPKCTTPSRFSLIRTSQC